jgi:hypothetical protein
MSETSTITVRPGQVWESTDRRGKGRRCRIVSLATDVQRSGHVLATLENVATRRRSTISADRLTRHHHWRLSSDPDPDITLDGV